MRWAYLDAADRRPPNTSFRGLALELKLELKLLASKLGVDEVLDVDEVEVDGLVGAVQALPWQGRGLAHHAGEDLAARQLRAARLERAVLEPRQLVLGQERLDQLQQTLGRRREVLCVAVLVVDSWGEGRLQRVALLALGGLLADVLQDLELARLLHREALARLVVQMEHHIFRLLLHHVRLLGPRPRLGHHLHEGRVHVAGVHEASDALLRIHERLGIQD
mmetsp:Transcript_32642/g.70514  ORF Transcript_32642/g.70514 Transcript_32642/m.70514 type:complete len:221 (-) Transcript_32642:605-1267(-)